MCVFYIRELTNMNAIMSVLSKGSASTGTSILSTIASETTPLLVSTATSVASSVVPTSSSTGLDPGTVTLIVSQCITFILLVVSEVLPVTSPYSSIIQAIIAIFKSANIPANLNQAPVIATVNK